VLAEDKLFATLDTRSRRLRFPEEREVIITDTVGFIRDLPKDLFAAFRATFEETADADLLLHVVDASDPAKAKHIETTEKLLSELSLLEIPRLLVFNKIDLVPPAEALALKRSREDALFVCARSRETTRALLDRIAERLADRWAESDTYPGQSGAATSQAVLDEEGETAKQGGGNAEVDANSLTTLEEMLGTPRRRQRSPARA
jgi:GTP-binding protein HflX